MEILNNYHKISGVASEYEMQEQVDLFLKQQIFRKRAKKYPHYFVEQQKIVLREFRVPEVNRISDHVLLINNNRAVNIECKLDNIDGVIKQAEDHLRWCDYSVICLPPDGNYIANYHKEKIIKKGIGLWYWFKEIGIFEFILPKFNRNKNPELRKEIISRIRKSVEQTELILK